MRKVRPPTAPGSRAASGFELSSLSDPAGAIPVSRRWLKLGVSEFRGRGRGISDGFAGSQ